MHVTNDAFFSPWQDIDHVGYLHQAFESASLGYFIEILDSDLLKEIDVSNLLY